jgi:hypothetical protein
VVFVVPLLFRLLAIQLVLFKLGLLNRCNAFDCAGHDIGSIPLLYDPVVQLSGAWRCDGHHGLRFCGNRRAGQQAVPLFNAQGRGSRRSPREPERATKLNEVLKSYVALGEEPIIREVVRKIVREELAAHG